MIHINYLIKTNIYSGESSTTYEISDTSRGIDTKFNFLRQFKGVERFSSLDKTIEALLDPKLKNQGLRYDVPTELPHVCSEMKGTNLTTRENLGKKDIKKIIDAVIKSRRV